MIAFANNGSRKPYPDRLLVLDRRERRIARGQDKIVGTKRYWTIGRKRDNTHLVFNGTNGRRYLMVFSLGAKAVAFLRNTKRKRNHYIISPLTGDELLKLFMGEFEFVGLDSDGTSDVFIVLRLSE